MFENCNLVFLLFMCVLVIFFGVYCNLVSGRSTTFLFCSLVEKAIIPRAVVGRSAAESCGVLGRTRALYVAAAVKVRDAPQFRHC